MPDDLLRFVSGPPGYSPWWLVLGLILLALVIAWWTAVFVATMPSARLRRMSVVSGLHARVLRYRFARTAAALGRQHRDGELTDEQTAAALSRILRSFLHQATGQPAQYMHVRAIAAADLGAAAPLLEALGDARFDRASHADVDQLGSATEELIRTWR
ncbi:hypothetical protein [Mycobacterium sp. SMC-4]|uniref:hypothetical protein n=1 Tax=Mycobacterium sp. SMC-4 TaxID=2857059 RepID=UPI0021B47780|nr:hypothetical protein [Mycobacterium sp. SMC-4]UXA18687.1 hypothetical protein KXD98_02995 [Mycobacterium sp. SMC-4]